MTLTGVYLIIFLDDAIGILKLVQRAAAHLFIYFLIYSIKEHRH